MSERFLDYPPAAVRFPEAVRKRAFWPCWSYLVPLKGISPEDFNSFDTLVLKLTDAGITGIRDLSSRTGLEGDLLVFIQDRLFHRGFLDERLHLTEQAMAHLEKAPKSQERTSYCYVYRDAVSGALLNFLVPQGGEILLNWSSIKQETDTDLIYYPVANAGKETREQTIRLLRYPQGQEERPLPVPSPREVSDLIKLRQRITRTRSRSVAYGVETAGIKVEKVYIAVDIILQEGESRNWIVSDGFSSGFSPVFENAIGHLENDDLNWLSYLKRKSAAHIIDPDENAVDPSKKRRPPESSKDKRVAALSQCETLLAKYPETTNDTVSTSLKQEDSSTAVRTLYEAMEWTFSFLASRSRYSDSSISELYQLGDAIAVARAATRIARSLGFALPDGDQFPLFRAKPGAVTGSYRGSPSLWPLLVLSLFNARRSQEHPLRTFVKKYPDAVEKLASLKKLRDQASHTQQEPVRKAELEAWMRLVRDYGNVLVPTGTEKGALVHESELTYKREQRRIQAEAAAERNLGYAALRALPSLIADLAVEVETHFVESPVTGMAVLSMDKLLGSVFQELLETCGRDDSTGKREKALGKRALEKACKAGIRIDTGKLEPIVTAKDEAVRSALAGNGSSMQATCAAWLLCLPEDELRARERTSDELKAVIEAAGDIANLRKHGYAPAEGTYTEAELKDLKQVVFDFIKNLVKGNRLQG